MCYVSERASYLSLACKTKSSKSQLIVKKSINLLINHSYIYIYICYTRERAQLFIIDIQKKVEGHN